jgi:aspartate-semialdehyde dehydrogenase
MKLAVVGATGLVGSEILEVLDNHNFKFDQLLLVASPRSVGKKMEYRGEEYTIIGLGDAVAQKPDIAIFSAGGSTSLEWAPKFAEAGTIVIDNSSAWRMDPSKKLVVPEINASKLRIDDRIIANPNCSTIQMVLPLKVLADAPGLERVVVATYQSASGAGQAGIDELLEGTKRWLGGEEPQAKTFAHPLPFEVLPHIGSFEPNGYSTEELKMTYETRKILGIPELAVSATCVRVPVIRGHSEAVTVDLAGEVELEEVRARFSAMPGLVVQDEPGRNFYPLARVAQGRRETFVGRLRRDLDRPRTLHFWVVSDNLLKGAATNAVQIAEAMVREGLIGRA